jgi:hypothetical protein
MQLASHRTQLEQRGTWRSHLTLRWRHKMQVRTWVCGGDDRPGVDGIVATVVDMLVA